MHPLQAQVIPDGTLPTTVSQSGNHFTIENGTLTGTNLFHSFSQFSVPTGGSAFFNNALSVQNIFARVTGGTVSSIDGLIQANGGASLFLLNPSGILFGPNASLKLGGSLIGTTANSIKFADGTEFSAVSPSNSPLLTMSVPVGLQMGANAGAITVQGTPANNFLLRPPTLSLTPNQTLALVGGQIDINSANLAVPDGQVELWAVQNGTVNLPTVGNWQLAGSSSSPTWGTITLRQSSNIDTTGAIGGPINIRGRGLTLQDGAGISALTGANGHGKGIHIQTTEFVDLLGVSHPENYMPAGVFTSVSESGATAGDITIDTQKLRLANGAWVQSLNYGTNFFTFAPINNAKTGNISVRATDVEVAGYSPFPNPFTGVYVSGAITTLVAGGQQNDSGAITVNADRVRLLDGGRISTDLLGSINFFTGLPSITTGTAGDISITARESLEIRGTTPAGFTSAVISSVQTLVNGQGGDITINTGRLSVMEGGTISSAISGSPIAALAGQGAAGNITIQATDVQVSDPRIDSYSQGVSGITVALGQNATGQGGNINLTANSLRVFNGGQITSSTEGSGVAGNVNLNVKNLDVQGVSPSLSLRPGQSLPSTLSASSTTGFSAGSVNLIVDRLQVRDGATIAVSNTGSGDAGNLNVNARNIFLDNGASLQAEVNGGSQGNINLTTKEVLLLRRGSNITTNAQGASTGGNININALAIVGLENENSDIVANAILGSGGNINITTQALLGLQFRSKLTPKSDITASSEFGLSGNVQVNTIGTDPNAGLTELPVNVTDPSQKIATGCAANQGSQFVATGRGGIPQNPNQQVVGDRPWEDMRDLSAYRGKQSITDPVPATQPILIQASGFQRNVDGTIALIASPIPVVADAIVTCSENNFQTVKTL
ncbi:S-layer family protein [Alkalinema sp. FACHB-956]|uniref:two-partner secretion domain-containing protein n=1 Tax=Alkalinema sp. FACHB-956 TaxID=2692768 RepID=UPI001684579D|nr:S-layer family protein [Alkalinema sp. FACHB-956]